MAKQKVRKHVTLPPCINIECHGLGNRTKKDGQYIWRCQVCENEWPRTERFG